MSEIFFRPATNSSVGMDSVDAAEFGFVRVFVGYRGDFEFPVGEDGVEFKTDGPYHRTNLVLRARQNLAGLVATVYQSSIEQSNALT